MIDIGLRLLLLDQPTITHIAAPQTLTQDNNTYERVFNESIPQGVEPPLVLIRQTTNDPMGTLEETEGMESTTFEISAIGRDFDQSLELDRAVSDFLKDYSGPAGPNDEILAVVMGAKTRNDFDEDQGGDLRQKVLTREYFIQHQRWDDQ